MRWRLRIIVVGCLALGVFGCSSSPRFPRYQPPDRAELDIRLVQWSDSVWTHAKAGDVGELDRLFASAPPDATRLTREWERVQGLKDEADDARRSRAEEICDAARDIDPDADMGDVLTLVDLRSTGLPPRLDERAGAIIDDAIRHWTLEAERLTRENRPVEASRAWVRVSEIAGDKKHPRLEITALDRANRVMSLRDSVSESGVLSWHDIERVLVSLVDNHVDGPEWRPLMEAGLDAVDRVCRDESGGIPSVISRIRKTFESTVAPLPGTGPVPSAIDEPLRRLCRDWWSEYLSEIPRPDRPDLIATCIAGMFAATDPRSRAYIGRDADRFRDQFDDIYLGIGTELVVSVDGMRMHPVPGGPARRAGVRDGDILLSVDGRSVVDLPLIDVVRRIQGPRFSSVRLGVRRGGEDDVVQIDVVRDQVHRVSVHGWRQEDLDSNGTPVWDWILDADAGIAYVSIREFLPTIADQFRAAMRDANRQLGPGRQVDGLILDLRGDPGGDRETTEDILDLFLDEGPLLLAEDRSGSIDGRHASAARTRLRGLPVVVMIDEGSASASEILAGALQGVGNAVVVGERSFGKGSVQRVYQRGDVLMVITQSWFHIPTREGVHRPIDRFRDDVDWGLSPDVFSPATDAEGSDAVRRRSRWISGRGLDVLDFESPHAEGFEPMLCTDRALLESLVLLQARLAASTFKRAGGGDDGASPVGVISRMNDEHRQGTP